MASDTKNYIKPHQTKLLLIIETILVQLYTQIFFRILNKTILLYVMFECSSISDEVSKLEQELFIPEMCNPKQM